MSCLLLDGHTVHYEQVGTGRPVVFLHGWSGSWCYWLPTMHAVGHLCRGLSFDFYGFGDSHADHAATTIPGYADQLLSVLDAMGIAHATLVGHSMGGMVAVIAALRSPERFTSVVTVGAPLHGGDLAWWLRMVRWRSVARALAATPRVHRSLVRFFCGAARGIDIADMLRDSVKSAPGTLQSAVRSMLHTDVRHQLAALVVPTLLVHGQRDDVVAPPVPQRLNLGSQARVLMLPGSRHFPFLDQPTLFARVLAGALQVGVERTPAAPLAARAWAA